LLLFVCAKAVRVGAAIGVSQKSASGHEMNAQATPRS